MKKLLLCAAFLGIPAIIVAQVTQSAAQADQKQADQKQADQKQVDRRPAQSGDPGITRQQADQILDELRQIRQLLQRQQLEAAAKKDDKPKRAAVNLKNYEPLGRKGAPVTMVEFTDYQCPFCQRFFDSTFADLKKNFIDTGKVRFYSRDYPLDFHPNAFRAAEAGRCAGDQDRFWQFRDLMGAHPDKLQMSDLLEYAGRLKMNSKQFQSCIDSGKYKEKIEGDILDALNLGIDGTPAFVIGKSTPDGVEGDLIIGALPYAMFAQKLRDAGAK